MWRNVSDAIVSKSPRVETNLVDDVTSCNLESVSIRLTQSSQPLSHWGSIIEEIDAASKKASDRQNLKLVQN